MDKNSTVAIQFLKNEALAAEQAGQDLLLEGDPHRHTLGCRKKAVFLADQCAADIR
jgi:hypothetical protein